MSFITSTLSSLADSSVGRNLKAAIPTALALSATGLSPIASTALGIAGAELAGSTTSFSDLGKQLAGLGTAVVGGAATAVGDVVDGVESVAAPVVFGLGAFINAVA